VKRPARASGPAEPVNARGPRLVIPSGLLGVGITALGAVALSGRFHGDARAIIVGAIAVVAADGVRAFRALGALDAEMATPTIVVTGASFDARARILGLRRPATIDPLFPEAEPTHVDGPEPFALTCHAAQRGIFNHLLVEVRCRSPLGLWASARRIAVLLPGPLWVAPAPGPPAPPTPAGTPRPAGRRSDTGPRDLLVRSARPYEPGDSRRLVHWPATAHEGRLMVRETEPEADPVPALVVDLRAPGEAAEQALGRALTTAADEITRVGRVRLVTAERADDDLDAAIPRAVLVPAATLRIGLPAPGPTRTVDRVETSSTGVQRRLAVAAPAPVDRAGLPADATFITDEDPEAQATDPVAGREDARIPHADGPKHAGGDRP
jgi:hypothetical protein